MHTRGGNLEHHSVNAPRSVESLPGPHGLPLVGNVVGLDAPHFHRTLERWAAEFGPVYKFRLIDREFVVSARRGDIDAMLHDRPQQWRRTDRMQTTLEEVGARGLFTAEGEDWRRQRKLVMHSLTPEVIHRFHPSLVRITQRLQRRWLAAVDAGRQPNMLRDLKAYSLDVIVGLAMGEDMNSLENESNPLQRDIEFLFTRVARRLTAPLEYWHAIKLPVDRETDAAAERVRAAVAGCVQRTRQRLAADPVLREKPSNMLEAMVLQRDAPGSGISDEDLVGYAVLMAFAGEDTTSNTIAWLLYLLANNPPALQRLNAEVAGLMQSSSVAADFRLLDRMKWLDLCAREAMRLKPVAPVLGFEPNEDLLMGDVRLPAGTKVLALTRHAFNLDTPLQGKEQFLPERWLEESSEAMDDPARKLVPFGGGPRFCPGRYLALTEIQMVTSMAVQSFSLSAAPDAPPPEELFTFTMTPNSLPLHVRRRVA